MMIIYWGFLVVYVFFVGVLFYMCSVFGNSDNKLRWSENYNE